MTKISLIFFGSFQHYSKYVLDALLADERFDIRAVITTEDNIIADLLKTNQEGVYEGSKGAPQSGATSTGGRFEPKYRQLLLTPDKITPDFINQLPECDLIVTAGYGKLLPGDLLTRPKVAPINIHFSLLPKYRGANPAEWAILSGEKETGITFMKMDNSFDTGDIYRQFSLPIYPTDTRVSLYEKLYKLAAEKAPDTIFDIANDQVQPTAQPTDSPTPFAERFVRNDGRVEWRCIENGITGKLENGKTGECFSEKVERAIYNLQSTIYNQSSIFNFQFSIAARALYQFPSVWTLVPTKKGPRRLKIHSCEVDQNGKLVLKQVQFEGQGVAMFNQVKNVIN